MLPAFSLEKDLQQDIKDIILYHAKEYTALSYYEIQTWVERAEKTAIINDSEVIKESDIYSYFMDSLRVRVGTDEKTGKLYLYKNG